MLTDKLKADELNLQYIWEKSIMTIKVFIGRHASVGSVQTSCRKLFNRSLQYHDQWQHNQCSPCYTEKTPRVQLVDHPGDEDAKKAMKPDDDDDDDTTCNI